MKLTNKDQPTVTSMKEIDVSKFEFDIANSGMVPAFVIYNRNTGKIIASDDVPRFMTIKARLRTSYFDTQAKLLKYEHENIPIVKCSLLKNTNPYKNLMKNFEYAYSNLCLEVPADQPLKTKADSATPLYSYLTVAAYPCSLEDETQCESFDTVLSLSLAIGYSKHYIQFADYENPFKSIYYYREELNVMPNIGTTVYNFIRKIDLVDQTSAIFNSVARGSALVVEREEASSHYRENVTRCTEAEIDSFSCKAYINFEIRSSGEVEVMTRIYSDFFSAFSEIGGFKEVVFTAVIILYFAYNNILMNKYLRSQLLDTTSLKEFIRKDNFTTTRTAKKPTVNEKSLRSHEPATVSQTTISKPLQTTTLTANTPQAPHPLHRSHSFDTGSTSPHPTTRPQTTQSQKPASSFP